MTLIQLGDPPKSAGVTRGASGRVECNLAGGDETRQGLQVQALRGAWGEV